MKIAFLLPSLANQGPIILVKDIVANIIGQNVDCTVFYFDDILEVDFPCSTQRISFKEKRSFEQYDILHSHMLRPDLYVAFNRKRIKPKVVTTLHNYMYPDIKNTHNAVVALVVSRFWLHFVKRFDKVICLSRHMLNYYSKFIKADKLTYIHNGRAVSEVSGEIPEHELEAILALKRYYKLIGCVAILSKRKGFDQIIRMLKLNNEFAVVLIGDGPEKNELIDLARSNKVHERCLLLGYKPNPTLYFPYLDLFAMTSRSEGFGLSLLEAASKGLPVVCSALPVFRELFTTDEVAFYTVDDIEELKRKAVYLLQNRSSFSANILKKYYSNYTDTTMAQNYFAVYQNMV